MSKQTAVEWLWEQMDDLIIYQRFIHLLEQAKAMEKEQIIDARENGLNEGIKITNNAYYNKWLLSEDYYNETYKGGQDERNT